MGGLLQVRDTLPIVEPHLTFRPEEFVAAGDFLAYKFGMWTWCVRNLKHYLFILMRASQGESRCREDARLPPA